MSLALPSVVVPVRQGAARLDACLASLERHLPAGAGVLIADDASAEPQVESLARAWCARSRLSARYLRRPHPLGFAANLDQAIDESGPGDVVVLKPAAITTAGWLQRLTALATRDAGVASAGAWSNAADFASFPRGDQNPVPAFPEPLAEAAASVGWDGPPVMLPAAVGPVLFVRREALRQVGGLDARTLPGERVLDDFVRRAGAMGWRHVLCPTVFIASDEDGGGAPIAGEEMAALLARWPDYQEQVARFIMSDPLQPLRERLQARIDELARSGPQRDLFD